MENEIQILENLIIQNSNSDCCSNNIRFEIRGVALKARLLLNFIIKYVLRVKKMVSHHFIHWIES